MSGSGNPDDILTRDEMLERISDAVVVLDSDFQCLSCNEQAEQLLDKDHDNIVGSHVWTVFPDMVGTEAQRKIEATMETGQRETCERYDDDIDRWFEVRVYSDDEGVSL